MSSSEPPIQMLCEKLIESRGVVYAFHYQALREYIKGLDEVRFLAEMVRVDNPAIFRYLQSAGLSGKFLQIATERWRELTE